MLLSSASGSCIPGAQGFNPIFSEEKRKSLLTLAAFALSSGLATAGVVIDDFTTAGATNIVSNVDPGAGCAGPTSGSHAGSSIMGGAGTRAISATRSSGTGCVTLAVDAGNSNTANFSSDSVSQGFAFLTGQGGNYVVTALDTNLTFQASHDLGAGATITVFLHQGPGAIPGGTYIPGAGVTVPLTSSSLLTYTVSFAALGIGVGTTFDGYGMIITGIQNSDIVIDNIQINMNPDPVIPEPSTLALIGGGLAGLALIRRRK